MGVPWESQRETGPWCDDNLDQTDGVPRGEGKELTL